MQMGNHHIRVGTAPFELPKIEKKHALFLVIFVKHLSKALVFFHSK